MAGWTHHSSLRRVTRLSSGLLGVQERQSAFFLDCCEGPIPETSGPADVVAGYSFASARILKLFWQATRTVGLYRSSSLSHWIAAEGTRP